MRRTTLPTLALWLLLPGACDTPPDATAGIHGAPPSPNALLAGNDAGAEASPEAVSLLGEPLYARPLDPAAEVALLARLDSAEAALEAAPGSTEAIIWLGRRQAYLGRYREAIRTFGEGIALHRDEPRFYRHRGHRYITVRELDRAAEDLEHAARLVSGQEDEVEPDGQPNPAGEPRSTLHTNIWYHLGLARYLQHDFEGAAHALRWGFEISPNDDMRVAMAYWLWLSLMRLERDEEARAVVEQIHPDMAILENEPYLRLLLLYKGELARDTIMPPPVAGEEPGGVVRATYGYGVGAWHLIRGDRLRARTQMERVLATGEWPAFGYIAAEAELLALGDRPPRADTVGSTQNFRPRGGGGSGGG